MPQLIIHSPSVSGSTRTEVELSRNGLSIGRHPGCDVILAGSEVALLHARVLVTPHGCLLHDEGRPPGARIDGQRMKQLA